MSKITRASLLCTGVVLTMLATPAHAGVAIGVDIGTAPPAPQVEVVPPPRSGYVWAPGYWQWNGKRHVWVAGHWMPARPGSHWIPEHWVNHHGRWHFVPGHWQHGR